MNLTVVLMLIGLGVFVVACLAPCAALIEVRRTDRRRRARQSVMASANSTPNTNPINIETKTSTRR